jgi:hypothetical protein
MIGPGGGMVTRFSPKVGPNGTGCAAPHVGFPRSSIIGKVRVT